MKQQSGNVLFLILIAVALFAALAYAVTSSSRGGKTNMTAETGDAVAGAVLNFTTAVQGAVLRMMTIRGVPITDLRFNNDISLLHDGSPAMGTMGTPSDPSLYVFHPQGGNVAPQLFETTITPCSGCTGNVRGGHFWVVWLNLPNVGTTLSDAVFTIADLRDDACLAINKKLGINFIPNTNFAGGMFAGTTSPQALTVVSGQTPEDQTAIEGKTMFCTKKINGAIRNNYVAVLKAY